MRYHPCLVSLTLAVLASQEQVAAYGVGDLIGGLLGTGSKTTTSSSAAAPTATAITGSTGLVGGLLNGILGDSSSSSSSNGLLGDILDPISDVTSEVLESAQNINDAITTSAPKTRPKSRAPACSTYSGLGGSCGNTVQQCCATGLTCRQGSCQRFCPATTTLPYCASSKDCDSKYGLVCIDHKCTKPDWAEWVKTGDPCDQGTGFTQYCLPLQAVCVSGTCEPCDAGA